jgi:hypothetical protein
VFEGSRSKIKRANHHISELQRLVAEFLAAPNIYRFWVEKDAQDGANVLLFEFTHQLPCAIPATLGDAVHNLRASLDLMAYELVRQAGVPLSASQERDIAFVFAQSRDEFVASVRKGIPQTAHAGIHGILTNDIRPYKGGDDVLFGLHLLDIRDKHILLTPLFTATELCGINVRSGGIIIEDMTVSIAGNRKVDLISLSSTIELASHSHATFDICFDKGVKIFEDKSILPALHQLSQLVSNVVSIIEKACT